MLFTILSILQSDRSAIGKQLKGRNWAGAKYHVDDAKTDAKGMFHPALAHKHWPVWQPILSETLVHRSGSLSAAVAFTRASDGPEGLPALHLITVDDTLKGLAGRAAGRFSRRRRRQDATRIRRHCGTLSSFTCSRISPCASSVLGQNRYHSIFVKWLVL